MDLKYLFRQLEPGVNPGACGAAVSPVAVPEVRLVPVSLCDATERLEQDFTDLMLIGPDTC